MHNLVLLLAAGALLCHCGCCASSVNRNVNLRKQSNTQANSSQDQNAITKKIKLKKFVNIEVKLPSTINHIGGGTLELSCNVVGSPAPSVQWLRNDIPILEYEPFSSDQNASKTSVARLKSTLLVKPSDSSADVYTCLATAGSRTARSSTVVYTLDNNRDLSERYKLLPLEPRIVVGFKTYLDTIGNRVVLPCKARGRPRPRVVWRDIHGEVIRHHPRMQVLRSGELVISQMAWPDMGEYTCQARNRFGTATAKTFLYPMAG